MKRLTIFVLLFSILACCLSVDEVQAQEKLFPLKHNPAYDLAAAKAEKGFRKSYNNLCSNPLNISITDFQKPISCGVEAGSVVKGTITVNVNGGVPEYNYSLNGNTPITSNDNTFTFEDLDAGAYFINVEDAEGSIVEVTLSLDEAGSNTFKTSDLAIFSIGCEGQQGRVSYRTGQGADRVYDIYEAYTNDFQGTVKFDIGEQDLSLDVGQYYIDITSNAIIDGDTLECKSFHIFNIGYEKVVRLPFTEDFSTSLVYPDDKLWSNNYAFINNTYATNAISMGVATLDGFNQFGQPYTPSVSSTGDEFANGSADVLTSNPFCFDGNVEDSLYMTFFFQEQGYGDFPNIEDSLLIEFEITRDTIYDITETLDFSAICFTLENETEFFEDCIASVDIISIDSEHIFYADNTYTSDDDIITNDSIYVDLAEYTSTLVDSTLEFSLTSQIPATYRAWETITDFADIVVKNLQGDTLQLLNETKIAGIEAILENPEFKRVDLVIPPEFVEDNFRFRFRNLATISGNNDHWNIDYIRLNDEPLSNNLSEVAHTQEISSMLKRYQQMPWKHFINHLDESLADNFYTDIRTINATSSNTINVTDYVKVNDVCLDEVSPILDRDNTNNYADDSVIRINQSKNSLQNNLVDLINDTAVNEAFVQRDSVVLEIEWEVISGANELLNSNDTLYRYQTFFNYFALDDGSAERAYGLNGIGSRLAMEYILNEEDSLRAIQINFVNMNANIENLEFNLNVWKSVKSETNEDSLLYSSASYETPHFLNQVNGFWTYTLETPIAVSDTIYVGLEQRNTFPMYIGFDRNINSADQTFYNTSGQWLNSIFEGTPMIRPVVGSQLPPEDQLNVGTNDIFETEKQAIVLYPNPTSDILHFKTSTRIADIEIYDYAGKMMNANRIDNAAINVQSFAKGLYLIRFFDEQKNVISTAKFVKQ
ncbi:MAG: T9SS type A sorting domain-containing protein [Chitinophagales bacterium]